MKQTKSLNTLFKSVNPLNNQVFHQAQMTSPKEIEDKIEKAWQWYEKTRHGGREVVEERYEKLSNVHALLE